MSSSAAPAIAVRDLRKLYGDLAAVDGVSLEIEAGEVFALLGPNGAGKTTLVEILEGYRRPTSGNATVLGIEPARGDAAWRARIGIVLQTTGMFEQLTVEEVVAHFATFYPQPEPVDRVLELVGMAAQRGQRCRTLSGGQKRRVDVALGIIGNPEIVFLDEPTTGFDPAARRQAWDVIRGLTALGKTVLLTTHYLDEAEHLADRVGIIVQGRLVEVGAPREIGGAARETAVVSFRLTPALSEQGLPPLPGTAVMANGVVRITTKVPTATVRAMADWVAGAGEAELPGLAVTRPTLEDIYLALIGDSHGDDLNAGGAA